MLELKSQKVNPDWIIFPSSSAGTQTGLILGAELYQFPGQVYGVSVDLEARLLREKISALLAETVRTFGGTESFLSESILIDDRFLGGGYGKVGTLEREAIHLFAREEGILLDPVYTARAAGGMLEMIRRNEIPPTETVLFWHTGGIPAIWAYAKEIL